MKSVLMIDDGINCAYDVFYMEEIIFDVVFPCGSEIAFSDSLPSIISREYDSAWERVWRNPVPKNIVNGIDAILFYGLDFKKHFYPSRKENDLDGWARSWNYNQINAGCDTEESVFLYVSASAFCSYDFYRCDDEILKWIFKKGSDISFVSDLVGRQDNSFMACWPALWLKPTPKKCVSNWRGILFAEDCDFKKDSYPLRSDRDLDGWARGWALVDGKVILNRDGPQT